LQPNFVDVDGVLVYNDVGEQVKGSNISSERSPVIDKRGLGHTAGYCQCFVFRPCFTLSVRWWENIWPI